MDGPGGWIEVALDGERVLYGWEGLQTCPAAGVSHFDVGAFASEENTSPQVVRVDNVILSTEPIGCP